MTPSNNVFHAERHPIGLSIRDTCGIAAQGPGDPRLSRLVRDVRLVETTFSMATERRLGHLPKLLR
jgi:hypothetical protein